jgi:hypothetical protein
MRYNAIQYRRDFRQSKVLKRPEHNSQWRNDYDTRRGRESTNQATKYTGSSQEKVRTVNTLTNVQHNQGN